MYTPFPSKKYEKSFKKLKRFGKFNGKELNEVIDILCLGKKLHSVYQDHPLAGEYAGYRECHIRGNILLIYRIENQKLILILLDIGTHSELFG